MSVALRVAVLCLAALLIAARPSAALTINVAEFSWTTQLIDPSPNCDLSDPECVPDPFYLSTFLLTNLWDGPDPGPTLSHSVLGLPDGNQEWFDLAPPVPAGGINIDQISLFGSLPSFADATVSFLFEGEQISLSARLIVPDTSVVLRFNAPDPVPVPEPGALTLIAVGVAAALTRLRKSTRTRI